jgi:hypothetical protein
MTDWRLGILFAMTTKGVQILNVEKDGEDGLLVTFSDRTIGAYVVEELLALRPIRELLKESKTQNPGLKPATQ